MLAFNGIGNLGRLGNQMFEYAALRGIAATHGYDWCIPPYSAESTTGENYSLHYCFKMEDVDDNHLGMLGTGVFHQERHFHYDKLVVVICRDIVSLDCFFQS